jgi:hypothetical protein
MARASNADPSGRPAAHRLRDALAELVSGDADKAPTAVALCELAGVSRNALYRYHSDVLNELQKVQRRRHRNPGKAEQTSQRLREENEALRLQVAKLAAVVDHYFAAWQETSALLRRRERELAEVRRDAKPQLAASRK